LRDERNDQPQRRTPRLPTAPERLREFSREPCGDVFDFALSSCADHAGEHDHTNGCPILAAVFAARVGTLTFLFQKEDRREVEERRESGRAALQRRVKHPTHNRASAPDGLRGESLPPQCPPLHHRALCIPPPTSVKRSRTGTRTNFASEPMPIRNSTVLVSPAT
jgi:hypothetical protein